MRIALILLVLALLAPVAAASHPLPGPAERLRAGERLSVGIIFEGRADASGSAARDDRNDEGLGSEHEAEHRWSSAWSWTATGVVGTIAAPDGALEIAGNASVDFTRATRRVTVSADVPSQSERITTSESIVDCAGKRGRLAGFAAASFRLSGDDIILTLAAPKGLPGATCEARLEEDDTHGDGRSAREPTSSLVGTFFSTKADIDGSIELRVPIDAAAASELGRVDASLPAQNAGVAGRLCGEVVQSATDLTVACLATETIQVRVWVMQCDALQKAAATHAAQLRAVIASPPAQPTQATLLAWAAQMAEQTQGLLADERAHQLAGCAPPLEGSAALARQGTVALRDALGRAAAQGQLDREGLVHLLGVEREVQIQEGPAAEGEVEAGVRAALEQAVEQVDAHAEVSVHSPVALRAVAQDGREVGWNASAKASLSAIDGATAEGVAGGAQRVVLPLGGYHLEIDEQALAHYILVLRHPDGSEESHLVRASPGQRTRIPIAVIETSDAAALRIYAPTRSAGSAPAPADATPAGEASGEGRGVPGVSALAVLAALALVARGRRP